MANYVFQITRYDTTTLLPQVSEALEKRTELNSRERYPGLWEIIDKLNAMSRGKKRSSFCTKIMAIICLVLGIFLFVPGLLNPQELTVPLIAGAFAIATGILYLYSSRKSRKNRKKSFDKSAKLLLMGKDNIPAKQSIVVSFSEIGMEIRVDGNDSLSIPYTDFESMLETADLFLFVYDTRITVLQKKDLTSKATDDFCNFISKNVPQYQLIM